MPKQPRLIDADKLLEYFKSQIKADGFTDDTEAILKYNEIRGLINSGTFDLTPPVQPDIKRGDRVRHKDHKHYGIGFVDDIAKSGKRAFCYFPDYDRRRSHWEPRSYYRLDKLEVITDDQR